MFDDYDYPSDDHSDELWYSTDPMADDEATGSAGEVEHQPSPALEIAPAPSAPEPDEVRADDQPFEKMMSERPAVDSVPLAMPSGDGDGGLAGGEVLTKDERRAAGNMEIGMDTWLAQLMVKRFGDLFVYCPELATFLVWDNRRWRMQGKDLRLMRNLAWRTGNSIWPDVATYSGPDQDRMIGAARTLHSLKGINTVIGTLPSISGVIAPLSSFGAKPYLLNAWNGTIELKTATLREHRKEDHLTNMVPCNFHPGLVDEMWDRFLHVSFEGNETEIRFMHMLAGLVISGDLRFEKWLYLMGEGENGKTIWGNSLIKMLGPEYAATPRPAMIEETRWAATCDPDMAELPGKRGAFIDELKKNFPLDGQVAKSIASSSILSANPKHRDKFDFPNEVTLLVAANDPPKVSDTSHGMWRKMLVVPFAHEVTEGEKDFELKENLTQQEHREGILSMSVAGYVDLITNGYDGKDLIIPARFQQAHVAYRQAEHPLAEWVEDRAILESGAETLGADIEADIRDWKTREHKAGRYHNDLKTGSASLSRLLTSLGLGKEQRGANGTVWRLGISLKYPRVDLHVDSPTQVEEISESDLAAEILAEVLPLHEPNAECEQPSQDETTSPSHEDEDEWDYAA